MSKSTRTAMVAAGLAALILTATSACSAGDAGGTGSSTGPIRVGGSMAQTGSLAATGQEYNAMYKFWANKVNSSGGLLGRQVELDIKNDNSNAATAQTIYQTMLTKNSVDLFLAPYATFVGAPIVPLARSANKVLYNGGFVSRGLQTKAEGWMVTSYTYQEPEYTKGLFEVVQGLAKSEQPKRIGILTNNNPFTLAVRDGYEGQGGALNFAKEAGIPVAYNETYSGDTTDFTAAVNGAKAANVDMFLILGLPNDTNNILKTAKVLGFAPKLACGCGSQVSTLGNWDELGAATNGVVSTTPGWSTQKNNGMADVEEFSKAQGHKVIPAYDLLAYSTLQILQQSVEGAKSLDQQKLKDYMAANTFDTAVGKLKLGADGTPPFSQILTQTVDGKTAPVWPAEVADHKIVLGK